MKPAVLFLCTGNSCRSQMAEAWLRHLKGQQYEACSAGIKAQGLNPFMVEVMQERAVDISCQQSTRLDEIDLSTIDWVVTVCGHAEQHCPTLPEGVRTIHYAFDDPPHLAAELTDKEQQLKIYRRVCDEIKTFILSIEQHLIATEQRPANG